MRHRLRSPTFQPPVPARATAPGLRRRVRLPACLVAVALLSCAPRAPRTAAPAAGGAAPPDGWERVIAPFEVRDAAGRPYTYPFLGGLDVPRPQFVDVDGDGDLDLFVQERTGELMHFENEGSPAAPRYTWRTDRYADLDVGEWARFVDVDGDGDVDVLGEQPFSYIRVWRNQGTPRQARFTAAADSLRDAEGRAIYADRQNIPQLTDLDCDDRLDLFLGRIEGTVTRFEEATRDAQGMPRFALVTDRFEDIEIIGQLSGGIAPSARHGANAMAFADHDDDGDLDFFWGDFFEPGVLYIPNTGSCAQPQLRTPPAQLRAVNDSLLTSGYNVPVFADIDGDGDRDLFVGVLGGAFNPNRTAADNLLYFERTGGTLVLRTRRWLDGIDVGSESMPALGDLDGDGDLDLLIGNRIDPATLGSARMYVFRNIGNARAPAFQLVDTLDLATSFHQAPALGDLDDDGDLDLLLGTWNEGVQWFRNEGSSAAPRWVLDSAGAIPLGRGSHATPALGDVDGDGDLDLFIGESSGEINFLRNEGTPRAPRFERVSESLGGFDVGRRSIPSLLDYDGDGDLDLVVGRDESGVLAYRNDGHAGFKADPAFRMPTHSLAAPAWGDLDGDGRTEALVGGLAGGLIYLRPRVSP